VRVFLDTNVLVSAFVSRGLCADLLRFVLREHEPVLSDLVVREFAAVLRDKLNATEEEFEVARAMINRCEIQADTPPISVEAVPGPAGAMILATAIHAGADVFITGDAELLEADDVLPIPVVSPRRFWQMTRPTDQPDPYPDPTKTQDQTQISEPGDETVKEKSFALALSIIKLCRNLESKREFVISRQLMRSGTSIGAQIEEAGAAESRKDFLHKMSIASKEARETNYWLRLLHESEIQTGIDLKPYLQDSVELVGLLTAIVKTTGESRPIPGPRSPYPERRGRVGATKN